MYMYSSELWSWASQNYSQFYLIYGMMDRVGSTCTTYRSFFNFKAIFTFLADYAKMMFVYMYSPDFGNIF